MIALVVSTEAGDGPTREVGGVQARVVAAEHLEPADLL